MFSLCSFTCWLEAREHGDNDGGGDRMRCMKNWCWQEAKEQSSGVGRKARLVGRLEGRKRSGGSGEEKRVRGKQG